MSVAADRERLRHEAEFHDELVASGGPTGRPLLRHQPREPEKRVELLL